MAWLKSARDFLARHGEHAGSAAKMVLSAAVPGAGAVADVVGKVLGVAQDTAKSAQEAEDRARQLANAAELERVGRVLDELNGRLDPLVRKVADLADDPDEASKQIRIDLSADPTVRAAFREIAGLAARFDVLEEQNRAVLTKLGYGQDMLETLLALTRRQTVVVDFVEELIAEGVRGRNLQGLVERMNGLAQTVAARPAEVEVELVALEAERPTAAVLELSAVSAVLQSDTRKADRLLGKATRQRPADRELADLSRRVTQAATRGDTDRGPKPPPRGSVGVGDAVGGWTLTQKVGEGGGGQVFRAERGGDVRALKVLLPELSADQAFGEAFVAECLTLSKLHDDGDRPHLVKFGHHSFDQTFGCWFFTMEFIEGRSLQSRLDRDGPLSPREAVELFVKLCGDGGLGAVHAKGIVHRDIKPANILLRADGSPVLVDFGLALGGRRGLTTVQRVTGYTAMFASPEQLRQKKTTPRSDVYSLVATLYYAVTKLDPEDFDPTTLPGELAALREVFTKGMAQSPAVRLETAGSLHGMLSRVPLDRFENSPPPSPPAPQVKRKNVKNPNSPPGLSRFGSAAARWSHVSDATAQGDRRPGSRQLEFNIPSGSTVVAIRYADGTSSPATLSYGGIPGYPASAQPRADGLIVKTQGTAGDQQTWLLFSDGENPDWSDVQPTTPPRGSITVVRSGDGVVYAGDVLWLSFAVDNIGKGDFRQLWAEVESESPLLDGLTAVFGLTRPGERQERCFVVRIPPDAHPGRLLGTLRFHEGNGAAPVARPVAFTVHPLPRPDISIRWRFVNDGSNSSYGTGDGKPKRGESFEVHVRVENRTGEPLDGAKLTLKPRTVPDGVRVFGPADDLGTVPDEGAADGILAFGIDPAAKTGPAAFELRLTTADGRTFAVETIETTIG